MPPFPAVRHDLSPLRTALGAAPARRPVNLLTGQPLNSFQPAEPDGEGLAAETRLANGRLARWIAQQDSFEDLLPILDRALQENPRQAGLEIEDLVAQLAEQAPEQAQLLADALPRFGSARQDGLPPIPARRPMERFTPQPKAEAENSFVSSPRKAEVVNFSPALIPAYKKQYSPVVDNWDGFKAAVERFPGMTSGIRRAFLETFAAEGGLESDGQTVAGITPEALDAVRRDLKLEGDVMPSDLSLDQLVQAYWEYMDRPEHFGGKGIGGIQNVESLNDDEAVAVLSDTLFRHGGRKGAEIIQKAMNRLLAEPVDVDKRFGSRTFAAFKRLIEDPADRLRLFEFIADGRIEDKPGEAARAEHFMFTPPKP